MAKKASVTILLAAFVLVASSAVCLASLHVGALDDCSGGMGHDATGALCPFMSSSVPTMPTGAFLVIAVAVLAVLFGTLSRRDNRALLQLRLQEHASESPGSFSSPVLHLISQGILHSRVYAF